MSLHIDTFVTGPMETNTFVLSSDEGRALLVDPSLGCDEVLAHIAEKNLRLEAVVLTHGHFDHAIGLPEVLERHPDARVYIHPRDRNYLTDVNYNGSSMIGKQFIFNGPVRELSEGETSIAGMRLNILHVPGHSPGGVALHIDSHCLCGDAVFAGSIGRTDFIGGDHSQLIEAIRGKLLTLPEDTVLHPGHGPSTTVGRELRYNPFLQ